MNNDKIKEVFCVVAALECPNCGDIIYSRAHHDFHWCSCGDIAVDGGFDYMRCSYKSVRPREITLDISATKQELYEDWNLGKNKFGLIKKLTSEKKFDKVKSVKVKSIKPRKT